MSAPSVSSAVEDTSETKKKHKKHHRQHHHDETTKEDSRVGEERSTTKERKQHKLNRNGLLEPMSKVDLDEEKRKIQMLEDTKKELSNQKVSLSKELEQLREQTQRDNAIVESMRKELEDLNSRLSSSNKELLDLRSKSQHGTPEGEHNVNVTASCSSKESNQPTTTVDQPLLETSSSSSSNSVRIRSWNKKIFSAFQDLILQLDNETLFRKELEKSKDENEANLEKLKESLKMEVDTRKSLEQDIHKIQAEIADLKSNNTIK